MLGILLLLLFILFPIAFNIIFEKDKYQDGAASGIIETKYTKQKLSLSLFTLAFLLLVLFGDYRDRKNYFTVFVKEKRIVG